VPLIPRWVLGAWWSRYWAYSEADVRSLVADFRAHDVPLDVFVLDMDWHTAHSWTGYSWNRALFPDPRGFLEWLHREGLHATLNLHPALGVQPFEDAYRAFAEGMGVDPARGEPVPFRVADRDFVRNYFELLHHPLEDEGVDFWWIDWQQGSASELPGLDPLPWLNHLHFADISRWSDRRPVVLSRWGGLGSHRYPVGFSGDSFSTWEALRFQPRYTAAGANVAYGWWSHDIGGHVGRVEPELYVRWVQFGALSPVLRLHSTNDPDFERLPWGFGEQTLALTRAAFRLRYELVPYLYTAARVAADTGLSPVRPTAWLAPEHDGAYLARYQYLLGDAILAAPVVHEADPVTGLATVDVWLPEGDWIERTTGEPFTGPRWLRLVADLARVPQFVRPGTILPLAEAAPTTSHQPADHLVLSVFPGAAGKARVYEDDGTSPAYAAGEYAWTTVTTRSPDAARCEVTVHGAEGEPVGGRRRYSVRLEGTRPPVQVTVDGAAHDEWRHDAPSATTVVEVSERPIDRDVTIAVVADGPLSARSAEHGAAVRAADLRRLLGDDTLAGDRLDAAARALPVEHPARAAAIALIGGPAIQVFEYTAPEEAEVVAGRVVVAAPTRGPGVRAEATWSLERAGATETVTSPAVTVEGDGVVLEAPFRWDGTLTPMRWSVEATAAWGDVVLRERHRSAVLSPGVGSWRVALADPAAVRAPADVMSPASGLEWRLRQAAPGDIDFPQLSLPPVLSFATGAVQWDAALVAHAATTVTVAEDRDVAFEYAAGGAVWVDVDGDRVDPDVTRAGPVPFYTLSPWLRRTAPVRLSAGRHVVLFSCEKTPDMGLHDWYLSVTAVDPDTGATLMDALFEAPLSPTLRPWPSGR
jgi:hypothetical protein